MDHGKTQTHLFTPGEQRALGHRARLFVISGSLSGGSFELAGKRVQIGRLPDNTIQLPFHGVSKHHCVLCADDDGQFFIEDSDSTNGTHVNDRPLSPGTRVRLSSGDNIRVCETTFFYIGPQAPGSREDDAEVEVDLGAAAEEAGEALSAFSEIVALSRNRRRK
jgi:pSer/pThr/pTyr-binding forkhead associated (FHA) protein